MSQHELDEWAKRNRTNRDDGDWFWKDAIATPDTDAMPTSKWTYTPSPPVTKEEDEWFTTWEYHNGARVWNSDTYMGSHGEKVKYSPKQREKFAQRKVNTQVVADWDDPHKPSVDPLPESARRIARKCDQLKALLVEKNLAYGNSALDPIRLFSKLSAAETMAAALDHKFSRIARGHEYRGEDTLMDGAGYLILYIIALEDEAAAKEQA